MFRLISTPILALLVTSCAHSTTTPRTAAEHDRLAHHYDATADSIEDECWKDRRNELTVNNPDPCWKAQDIRFLEANRNAAAKHRAEARRLSATSSAKR